VRGADAFSGLDHRRFLRADRRTDITHPNAEGHERIARSLVGPVASRVWPDFDSMHAGSVVP
jgi:hypothetical protein